MTGRERKDPVPDFKMPDKPASDDSIQTDDAGTPMLFDVVIPGEHMRSTGISLIDKTAQAAQQERLTPPVEKPPEADEVWETRVRSAVERALPKVLGQVGAQVRDAILSELARERESRQR